MNRIIYPVGTQLFLSQRTGDMCIDLIKIPYTVIGDKGGKLIIQSAKCNFPEECYFDTLPLSIEEDKDGDVVELTWHPKKKMWGTTGGDEDYPYYAYFGKYEYFPYVN